MSLNRRLIAAAFLGLATVLAGCGTKDETENTTILRDIVSERFGKGKTAPAAPKLQLTRAMLKGITEPFLEAELEQGGFKATLFVTARSGPHLTWKSLDNVTLSTRDDVLISTRGLPFDLMASDPSPIMSALSGAPADARRVMRWLTGDNQIRAVAYDCTIDDRGAARITVLERVHATRHLIERCTAVKPAPGRPDFSNEYWAGQGTIWRQRVWIGPELGHIRMDRLIR